MKKFKLKDNIGGMNVSYEQSFDSLGEMDID